MVDGIHQQGVSHKDHAYQSLPYEANIFQLFLLLKIKGVKIKGEIKSRGKEKKEELVLTFAENVCHIGHLGYYGALPALCKGVCLCIPKKIRKSHIIAAFEHDMAYF